VNRTVKNYRLIADYSKRPYFTGWFESTVKEYNSAVVACGQVMVNNDIFSPWVTLLFLCFWIILGGFQVMDTSQAAPLSLGLFLTNLNVFNAIGSAYGSIYKTMLKMQSSFDALEHIVHLMNLPIDVPIRMRMAREAAVITRQLRAEIREKNPDFKGVALDLLPVRVMNLQFGYGEELVPGLSSGNIDVQQGTMVSLVGPHGQGKSTLLKILGGVILPKDGACFVPSHLRVLHCGHESYFIKGSLYKNLIFGLSADDKDARPERVKSICNALGLESIMKYIDSDVDLPWASCLSHTEQHFLCLARALISNPEVFCVHKPTLPSDDKKSKEIIAILRKYVDDRGLEQDPETRHLRRPRTCVMTSAKMLGVRASDVVYKVSSKEGIQKLRAGAEIDEAMFA